MQQKSSNKKYIPEDGNSILVIESDTEFRTSLVKLLQKNGYKVFPGDSFEESLTYLKKTHSSLVIFGLNEPQDETGMYLNQIMLYTTSLLILSSYDWYEINKDFARFRDLNILIKPVKKEDIICQIQKLKNTSNYHF